MVRKDRLANRINRAVYINKNACTATPFPLTGIGEFLIVAPI